MFERTKTSLKAKIAPKTEASFGELQVVSIGLPSLPVIVDYGPATASVVRAGNNSEASTKCWIEMPGLDRQAYPVRIDCQISEERVAAQLKSHIGQELKDYARRGKNALLSLPSHLRRSQDTKTEPTRDVLVHIQVEEPTKVCLLMAAATAMAVGAIFGAGQPQTPVETEEPEEDEEEQSSVDEVSLPELGPRWYTAP